MSKPRQEENIYSSACIQALEQEYCSSCSAAVVSSRGLGARVVSRIYNGGRQALYTATVGAMLMNNMAAPAWGTTTNVAAGHTSTGLVANSGDLINVYGTTRSSIINNNGREILFNAGETRSTTVNSGGDQLVSGGTARGTIIKNGGTQHVASVGGARAISAVISAGGVQFVRGIAEDTEIQGGIQIVSNGASAYDTTIYQGGQSVESGGRAGRTTISSGGQTIGSGGAAVWTNIQNGSQTILSGGRATVTSIYAGGRQYIQGGGSANDTTLYGGTQIVSNGGIVTSTTLNGGDLTVSVGGSAVRVSQIVGNVNADVVGGLTSNTYISGTNQYGSSFTLESGVASNFVLNENGRQVVSSGGVANHTIINSVGSQLIKSNATANSTVINDGGVQTVSGGTANSTVINQGGIQIASAGGQINDTVISGGTQHIYNGAVTSNITNNSGTMYLHEGYTLRGITTINNGQLVVGNTPAIFGIQHLSANNAIIAMDVDLQNQTANELLITGSYNGNANLKLTNTATVAAGTAGDGIKLVDFGSAATVNGTFDLVGGQWDEGGFVYQLAQNEGDNDYYLKSTGQLTNTFKTMLNIPIMNVIVAQTGMNSLQRRLGDLRGMNNTQAKQGIWVRSYYKDMTVKDLAKTDMSLFGAEAGYDWLFNAEEPTKLYAGVLVGFVSAGSIKTEKNDGMYEKGDGQAPTVGVYATLVNENGWFVDIAARNFWTKLDMKNHTSDGTELAYKPERNVLAASVEVGKSFDTELSRGSFIRIEPKVEVSYMNAASDEAKVSNGNKLTYDAANYVDAKAGVLFAYEAVRSNGLLIEPLLELAYRYNFSGKDPISYAGATADSDLKGGTAEINAGLNMQLTDNLYWYSLGSYEASDKVKGWGVHAGIRYAFGEPDIRSYKKSGKRK